MRSGAPAHEAAADLQIARTVLFLSGFAGLGYEMLWTRMLSTVLGHEISAVLAVVAAFFCGCALGSWALDGPVRRSPDPVRWYAWIEVVIGSWSLALSALLPLVVATAAGVIGAEPGALRQWAASFGISFLALAPATIAMGATLPAIERIVTGRNAVGTLYAANTLGAVAGLMATTYALIPALGLAATSWVLAAANLVCAGAALALLRGRARTTAAPAASRPDPAALSSLRLGATAFLAGLLGIGFEVLVTRVLGQVLENTVYSFSSVLGVFLVGTALGAALAGRLTRGQTAAAAVRRLLVATSAACLLGVAILPSADGIYRRVQAAAGGGQAAAIGAEIVVATLVLLLPTMAMGATFSVLAQRAVQGGLGLGRLLAANTLGASLAPALFGVALLPAVGSRTALLLTSAGYLTLVPEWRGRAWRGALAPAALAVLVLAGPGTGRMVTLEPGDRLLDHREGVMATVSVVEDARGERHLKVNDRFQMGGTTSFYSDVREAEIPLLLHSDPRRALFLGLGAGVTFAAAAQHPELEAVGVELLPEVVGVLPRFEKVTGDLSRARNLRIVVADARRFVLATPETFDVVVGDLFHPSRDGAGALYTVEHFEAVRRRLRPGGLYCQWLPLYQLDLDVLRTITRSFRQVFPEGRLHLAHYSLDAPIVGLIGFEGAAPGYAADWLERRAVPAALGARLESIRLASTWDLLGTALAGPPDLAAFAGSGPLNTDDRPVVTYTAPRFAYGSREPAADCLVALIDAFGASGAAVIAAADRGRLGAYIDARNGFVRAGRGIAPTADVHALVRAAREPLLAAVRTSADFSAAYNPLLAMAGRLHDSDPEGARVLLQELDAAQPGRREARDLLAQFAPRGPTAVQERPRSP